MKVYPIFLNDLAGRRCVVFGGGGEAERKILELLECQAAVVLVSETATPRLSELAELGAVDWQRRSYRPGDLANTFLAIATETNPDATAPIYDEALRERVLFNAMDDVQHCTFVAGSVVRRGSLVVAISTSGAAPAVSVRLRERLEREIGEEYETLLDLLAGLREPMAERYPSFEERRAVWYRVVDSDVLDVIASAGADAARNRIAELTGIQLTPRSTR
ncbi:MAG TPA: bifunctional precorrin-2 dehydrogenase/sirohydrochlorin ferrochelatase [Rhodothermales bacterium]